MTRIGCALLALVLLAVAAGTGPGVLAASQNELSVVDRSVEPFLVGLPQAAGALITAIHHAPRSLARLVRIPPVETRLEPTDEAPRPVPGVVRLIRDRQRRLSGSDDPAPH